MDTPVKEEKLTVDTVIDDLTGGVVNGVGIVAASMGMKLAASKFTKLPPIVISLIGVALGIAARIGCNFIDHKLAKQLLKEFSTGIIGAGSLDAALKLLDNVTPTWRASLPASVSAALPQLSGPAGGYANASQGGSTYRMLNGFGSVDRPFQLLN